MTARRLGPRSWSVLHALHRGDDTPITMHVPDGPNVMPLTRVMTTLRTLRRRGLARPTGVFIAGPQESRYREVWELTPEGKSAAAARGAGGAAMSAHVYGEGDA